MCNIFHTIIWIVVIYRVVKKCPDLFLLELRQISTEFDSFWHTDS